MGFLSVEGTFREFEASLILEKDLISQVEGEIWVASINTEEPSRDETLLSEGYLDAEQFRSIHFSSSFIDKEISGYTITGTLRIKGEERTVTIPCGIIIEQDQSVHLNGKITIKRSTFNLDFGSMDALIGDEIQVSVQLVFIDRTR